MSERGGFAAFSRRLPDVRPSLSLRDRLMLVRRRWRFLVRLAISTSVAYFVATELFGHSQAFFAPIAAVLVINSGAGPRSRTLYELIFGVVVGVGVGELLILTMGRGAWQLALIGVLAAAVGLFLGLKGLALNQAANSAVLLAAVVPLSGAGNPAVTRVLDALIGGLCGLAMMILLPRNTVRDIGVEVQDVLKQVSGALDDVAEALATGEPAGAERALERTRELQPAVETLRSTAENVSEIARMSPMRWTQRGHVNLYVGTIAHIDNAVRDARVLARRSSAMLRHHEVAPAGMADAVRSLARAVGIFADDLAVQADFEAAQLALIEAARTAVHSLPASLTLNTAAVSAQVRSLSADLLLASGMTREDLDEHLDFDD
ncbi:FUSC family protein [Aeromicrobium sp. IC_218]|uniref:FUSC family protein n=1 Tax=Aeromicrobium sp. IC_218 TaxID=2545468 RepID=UPI00103FA1A9|nr:FUSC family protein [Aeromicrobium sp. IC_218]TCI96937.1 hypothetical protein E0W78_12910 [Aeromicrobium sp. IC_218]